MDDYVKNCVLLQVSTIHVSSFSYIRHINYYYKFNLFIHLFDLGL